MKRILTALVAVAMSFSGVTALALPSSDSGDQLAVQSGELELVTKTVRVFSSSGQPYVGAHVAVVLYDDYSKREFFAGTVEETDTSGVAELLIPSLPGSGIYASIAVQPRVDDLGHAAGEIWGNRLSLTDQTFDVTLEPAAVVIDLVKSSGAELELPLQVYVWGGTEFEGGDYAFFRAIRPGPIALSSSTMNAVNGLLDQPGVNASLQIREPGVHVATSFDFGRDSQGALGFYSGTELLAPATGRLALEINENSLNIFGQLLSPDGSESASLDASTVAQIGLGWDSTNPINTSGSFVIATAAVDQVLRPVFYFSGEGAPASFVGPEIYVSDSGQLSRDGENYVAASSFSYDVRLPAAPTFTLVTGPETSINLNIYGGDEYLYFDHHLVSGVASWFLPASSTGYEVSGTVNPGDRRLLATSSSFELAVAPNGDVTGVNGGLTLVAGTRFAIAPIIAPSVVVNLVDAAGESVFINGWSGRVKPFMGSVGLFKPANAGDLWESEFTLYPSSGINYGTRIVVVADERVGNGSYEVYSGPRRPEDFATDTGNMTLYLPEANGSYVIPVRQSNATVELLAPGGSTPPADTWFSVVVEKFVSGQWSTADVSTVSDQNSYGFAFSSTGEYRLIVDPGNFAQAGRTVSDSFFISDLDSLVQLPPLVLKATNFFMTASVDGQSQPARFWLVQAGDVVSRKDSSGTAVGLALTPGIYTLNALPIENYNAVSGLAMASAALEVSDNGLGGLTMTVDGQPFALGGVFDFAFEPGGITLKLIDPRTGAGVTTYVYASAGDNLGFEGDSSSDGEFHVPFAKPGQYSIYVEGDWQTKQLRGSDYSLVITSESSGLRYTITNDVTGEVFTAMEGSTVVLPMLVNNLTGRITVGENQPFVNNYDLERYGWVTLYEIESAGNYKWVGSSGIDSQGRFVLYAPSSGDYRLDVRVYGAPGLASTAFNIGYVDTAAIAGSTSGTLDVGDLELQQANVFVNVVHPTTGAGAGFTSVEVRQGGNFLSWQQTNSNGAISFFLEEGDYELVLHPNGSQQLSRAEYSLSVDANGTPSFAGITGSGDPLAFNLPLSLPNVGGTVFSPGTPLVGVQWGAQVVPVEVSTGNQLWQYSQSVDSQGRWFMNLPAGSYRVFARSFADNWGDSFMSEIVTVTTSGAATLASGVSALQLNLQLRAPTWSGVVYEPNGTTPAASVWMCLELSQNNSTCRSTDQLGRWAFSAPEGFTGFTEDMSLRVADHSERALPELRVRGKAQLESLFGGAYVVGGTYSDLVITMPSSNLVVTVNGGAAAIAGVWVNLHAADGDWLGSGRTDQTGKARFSVENPFTEFWVWASPDSASDEVRDTFKSSRFEFDSAIGSGTREVQVSLPAANFWGRLLNPDGSVIRHSWVDVQRVIGDGYEEWIDGGSSNHQGLFSLSLPQPTTIGVNFTYRLTVRPGFEATSGFGNKRYVVTVNSAGIVRVADLTGTEVQAELVSNRNRYTLTTASSNVVGAVIDPSGNLVRDSWVSPLIEEQGWVYRDWENSTNSRQNGEFGLILADGTHWLEAAPPWASGYSRSDACEVVVTNGSVNSGATSCWNSTDNRIELELREPNLWFKLVDENNSPVRDTYVHVGFGSWYDYAHSNASGEVGLFIDPVAIARHNAHLQNGDVAEFNMHFTPPWNSSDLVSWTCKAGQAEVVCADVPKVTIGQAYASTDLRVNSQGQPRSYEFKSADTRVSVVMPDGETPVGSGAWVSLSVSGVDVNCTQCRWGIGSNSTSSSGKAGFVVPDAYKALDSTARFHIYIQPPWNRQNLTHAEYDNLTYDQLVSGLFGLRTPNVSVRVLLPKPLVTDPDVAARWASVHFTEVESDGAAGFNYVRWVTGTGTDQTGRRTLFLEPGRTYRVEAWPSNSSQGSPVNCVFELTTVSELRPVTGNCEAGTVSQAGDLDQLVLQLGLGNVSGRVTDGSNAGVAGAIVYATNDDNPGVIAQTTVTKADGSYSFSLDPGSTWTIKVFTDPDSGLQSNTTGFGLQVSSGQTYPNLNFQLAPVQPAS